MRVRHIIALVFATFALSPAAAYAQDEGLTGSQEPRMYWDDYAPKSTLVVPGGEVKKSKFPFIDVHSHHWRSGGYSEGRLDSLVMDMDAMNMAVAVNLSGGRGADLKAAVDNMKGKYPNRFVVFANVDFSGIDDDDWTERTVRQLRTDIENGAQGLKIYKNLGMSAVDSEGNRIRVDDERIDPVWALCGEMGVPVLIHTADPAPFWDPHDRFNERWFELKERPRRIRRPGEFPPWADIMAEQHNVFRKHSGTNFISAHMGWMANDLPALGKILDELPNVYAEMGAVVAEIGRQPRFAKEWLTKYKDRILFGKDSWAVDEYRVYFRVLETEDDYFDYYRKRHAHWKIYGVGLPDDVLRAIYYENALRIIPGIDHSAWE